MTYQITCNYVHTYSLEQKFTQSLQSRKVACVEPYLHFPCSTRHNPHPSKRQALCAYKCYVGAAAVTFRTTGHRRNSRPGHDLSPSSTTRTVSWIRYSLGNSVTHSIARLITWKPVTYLESTDLSILNYISICLCLSLSIWLYLCQFPCLSLHFSIY